MPDLKRTAPSARPSQYGADDLFRSRWSPRAMTGEMIPENDLLAMLEAAHWAPSASNTQPWRFLYARRDSEEWQTFFELLVDGNKAWCQNAAVLVVIVSRAISEKTGKPMPTHAFDTGSAWVSFALEGARRGLVVHGMAGFDYDRAKTELNIPEGFTVQAMAAVGVLAAPETLDEPLRSREKPSGRKSISEIAIEGKFTSDIL